MPGIPPATRLAVHAVAEKLRERADTIRPDEDLATSIAVNAALAGEFARAYESLCDLGLEDKVLDDFALENATPSEIREAAGLLQQLMRAGHALRHRKRGEKRVGRKFVRKFRVAAVLMTLLFGVTALAFAAGLFVMGTQTTREWWLSRGATPAAPREAPIPLTAPLAPVDYGFEKTASNHIVPVTPKDFVTDRAGVLPADAARALNARLAQFERETSNQVLVFIDRAVPPGTTMEEMTSASLRHWRVGRKGRDNGAILFVFLDDRKMRIEVGYGLEGVLTDARAKRITSQIMKPLFQQQRFAEGIEAGARAMMDVTRGGDAALDAAERSGRGLKRLSWLVPSIGSFALGAAFLAFALYIFRGAVLFLRGRATGMFLFADHGGSSGGGGSSSSDAGDSSSDSSGSYSGGGGDGGGGGASDSW